MPWRPKPCNRRQPFVTKVIDGLMRRSRERRGDGFTGQSSAFSGCTTLATLADEESSGARENDYNNQEYHPNRDAGRNGDDRSRRKVLPFRLCDIAVSDSGLGAGLCISNDERLLLDLADVSFEFSLVSQLDGYRRILTDTEFCDSGFHFRGQRRFLFLFRLRRYGRSREE